ncbi:MAG: Gfo/Idh/MocA family oxidoreductase [Patescibacteria group bacterium]
MLRVAIIGLGKQALDDHIPAIVDSELLEMAAVCDIDEAKAAKTAERLVVPWFTNVGDLVQKIKFDVAVLAVPHNQYLPIIITLANAGIHIIKEKPFATTIDEAISIHKAISGKVFLGVTLQRRFNPIYQAFPQMQRQIGKIYSIEGKYTFNITDLGSGWRASKKEAGGGALIDMGYHLIDLLVWYFGMPKTVTARMSCGNRVGQQYDVEDTVNVLFDFYLPQSYSEKTIGNFIISRVYPNKQETMTVYGTKGIVELKRGELTRYDCNDGEVEKLIRKDSWPSALSDQLTAFVSAIESGKVWGFEDLESHIPHVAIIQAAYDSDSRSTSCSPEEYLKRLEEVRNG